MKNTISLKLNRDFRRLYSKGSRSSGAYVAVYVSKNRFPGINRLGFTATKALGHAVVRNRAKRLMRAAYSELEPFIGTGYDIILAARGRIVGLSENQVCKDVRYSFHKLNLFAVSSEASVKQNIETSQHENS